MSVKIIGKAIGSFVWNAPRWKVAGATASYGMDQRIFDEHFNINGLLEQALLDFSHQKKASFGYTNEQTDWKISNKTRLEKKQELLQSAALQIEAESVKRPIRLQISESLFSKKSSDLIYCLYKGCIYKFDRASYSEEEMIFQIMEIEDKERQKFERLKNKFSLAAKEERVQIRRMQIPEEVRIAVWRRDEGKCVRCNSRVKLEYDHIIPHSKGGSDTVRNIELLCEKCNREKKDNIG